MFEDGLQINWGYILDVVITYGIQIVILIIALLIVAPIGKKVIKTALKKSSSRQSEARIQTLEKLLLNVFSFNLPFYSSLIDHSY